MENDQDLLPVLCSNDCLHLPPFGFLVPRSERRNILAATVVHNKVDHRAPHDCALIRCFIGGAAAEANLVATDATIAALVRADLREILGITVAPQFVRIQRWPHAMAQYEVGHLQKMERIRLAVRSIPHLALAGNGYTGIGVPDCIRSGAEAAATIMAALTL